VCIYSKIQQDTQQQFSWIEAEGCRIYSDDLCKFSYRELCGNEATKSIIVHKGSGTDKAFFVLAHNAMVIAFIVKRIRNKG